MRFDMSLLRRILVWTAVGAAVYFGNVRLQTWLGHRAIEETGLTLHTLEEGLQLAGSGNRLVLVDVSAIWCSSCRTFDRKVLADPEVRGIVEDRFVFVRIEHESEAGEAFRERYGVKGFPRLLVLDAAGELVAHLPTVYDAAVFRHALEGVGPG
jgi:thiol:disulfide interchange protein